MWNFLLFLRKTALDFLYLIPTALWGFANFIADGNNVCWLKNYVDFDDTKIKPLLWVVGLIAFVVIYLVKAFIATKQQKNRDNQRCKECERSWQEDHFYRFSNLLQDLSEQLSFGENNQRISVYKYTMNDKWFVLLARYSNNPVFCKKGRPYYQTQQGVIWDAWQNTETERHYPAFNTDPERWYQEVINGGLPREVAEKMNMKSQHYYALRINDKDNHPFAIVVFECLSGKRNGKQNKSKNSRFSFEVIKQNIKSIKFEEKIVNFICENVKYEPSPTFAEKEGI